MNKIVKTLCIIGLTAIVTEMATENSMYKAAIKAYRYENELLKEELENFKEAFEKVLNKNFED